MFLSPMYWNYSYIQMCLAKAADCILWIFSKNLNNEPGSRIIFKPQGDPETSCHADTVNREFSQLRTTNSELERLESIILSC